MGRPLRVALLQPTYWPEVTRGTERIVHDLGTLLASRGHEVTLITSHPGPTTTSIEEGVVVIRNRRPPRIERLRWYEDHLENAFNVVRRVRQGGFDVVQAFHNSDAWAAVQARRLGGPPVVYSFHGLPDRAYLVERRYRTEFMREAIERSAVTTVLSEAAAVAVRRYLQHQPVVLPAGVFTERFEVDVDRDPDPTLICAASLGDPRKRGELLFAAFAALRRQRKDVRLLLARGRDPVLSRRSVAMPEGAESVESGAAEDLAPAYARSWASVLAAVGEAQGMVLLESLAAGTPVVAARSGACPEIVNSAEIGVLVEPDDEASLREGLVDGLELGLRPETIAACRARAADYDWSRLIGEHERVLERAADSR